mmetsp:Transcript_21561/g.52511  ORF Transcript_21561/g.52511 Transcript_21561/m.52511 type:complete len:261 (-) Transcript_21561:706-1488(-)
MWQTRSTVGALPGFRDLLGSNTTPSTDFSSASLSLNPSTETFSISLRSRRPTWTIPRPLLLVRRRYCRVLMHMRTSHLAWATNRCNAATSTRSRSFVQISCSRWLTWSGFGGGISITFARSRSGFSTRACRSLAMQMMGRRMARRSVPVLVLAFRSRMRQMMLTALAAAPSISSRTSIRAFILVSLNFCPASWEEHTASILVSTVSAVRSSDELLSAVRYPAWRAATWARVVLPTPGSPPISRTLGCRSSLATLGNKDFS